ncbi:two-component system sensor histidine kinase UhpB [Amaricoccus macauensis]|uniref:Two-component system sensor histidine kinase UhpB n=1 Tax=Amaricoccus macauensis TaxID=57001 RepID=A0A840SIC4_9RHOB|nr:histidine kinase [Amaricoccus macauensis]MBB5221627.1 two-component system sensor histidine kinase UhpB [Amaricoccus macauensis]
MSDLRTIPLRRVGVLLALCTSVVLSVAVAGILIANARRATQEEVATAFGLATAYLDQFRLRLQQGGSPMDEAQALARQFDALRHIEAVILGPSGAPIGPAPNGPEAFEAPDWFVWLLSGEQHEAIAPITRYPNFFGSLVLRSDVRDEADEVWSDFRAVLIAIVLVSIVTVVATLTTVHLIHRSLAACNLAIRRIAEGDLTACPPVQRLTEFAELRDGIEHLASDLGQQQAENRLLQQRLMTLSDSERRKVASDLHDGLGPPLFALRVAAAEAEVAAGSTSPASRVALAEEVDAIGRHAANIQTTLRAIIYQLSPMIEAGVTPAELLGDLGASFAEIAPEVALRCDFDKDVNVPLSTNTGFALSRFVQESALNAVRHGGARRISVSVHRRIGPDGAALLACRLTDDGIGPRDGAGPSYGQTGITDRAVALGGRYRLPFRVGGETVTEIELPLSPSDFPPDRRALPDHGPVQSRVAEEPVT